MCGGAHVPRLRKQPCKLGMIRWLLTPKGCPVKGALQCCQLLRVPLCPLEAAAEHFLGARRPDGCRGHQDRTDPSLDGDAVPGLSNTKPVNLSRAQRVDQKGRWYHH